MGCGGSAVEGRTTGIEEKRRALQPKTPILLFYLPGLAKDTLIKILPLGDKSASRGQDKEGSLNIRFIDAQNTRHARRFWIKELQNRTDCAAAFYLADLRDHCQLLLAARTGNWFLRGTQKVCEIKVVTIFDNEAQLEEFQSYIPKSIELIKLCEKEPETVSATVEVFREIEQRYVEQKHQASKTTTRV